MLINDSFQGADTLETRAEVEWEAFLIIYALTNSKSLRHREFPGGPPSKYYPGPTMLNFRDRTRTGVFIVVWS